MDLSEGAGCMCVHLRGVSFFFFFLLLKIVSVYLCELLCTQANLCLRILCYTHQRSMHMCGGAGARL